MSIRGSILAAAVTATALSFASAVPRMHHTGDDVVEGSVIRLDPLDAATSESDPDRFLQSDSPDTFDYSSGACINELWQESRHPGNLTCSATNEVGKFWRSIHLRSLGFCEANTTLTITELEFISRFNDERLDFGVYVYAGSIDNAVELTSRAAEDPSKQLQQAVRGDTCAVTTFGPDDVQDSLFSRIRDFDGDLCRDVVFEPDDLDQGVSVDASIRFRNSFEIPCVAGAAPGDDTVKLQFCGSWRHIEDNPNCNVGGPSPCVSSTCWCDEIDLGVVVHDPASNFLRG